MTDFPSGISTFRTRANLPNQTYDPAKTTTLYNEDITRIEDELKSVEQYVLDGDAGIDTVTREIINLTERQARGIVRVKYGIFNYVGGGGGGAVTIDLTDNQTLHISVCELADDTVFTDVTIKMGTINVGGDVRLGIYDAYTGNVLRRIQFPVATSDVLYTQSIGEIVLPAGQYVVVVAGATGLDGVIQGVQISDVFDQMNSTGVPTRS